MNKQIPGDDLFSMRNSKLISSRLDNEVYLDCCDLNSLIIPKRFNKKTLNFSKENYSSQIRSEISPICDKIEELGYGGNIYSAL